VSNILQSLIAVTSMAWSPTGNALFPLLIITRICRARSICRRTN